MENIKKWQQAQSKLTTQTIKGQPCLTAFCPSVFTSSPHALGPCTLYPRVPSHSIIWEREVFTCWAKRQKNRGCKQPVTLFTSEISKVGLCLQQKSIFICLASVRNVKEQLCWLAKPAFLSVQTAGQKQWHLSKSRPLVKLWPDVKTWGIII